MTITRKKAVFMLLVTTLIWGGGFVASQYALATGMSPSWILTIRFLLGALLILLCFFPRVLRAPVSTVLHGTLAGLILFLGFLTQLIGQGLTSVPNTAFLTSTNVLMVPFLVWLFTHHRPKNQLFVLCFFTMIGIIFLTLDGDLRLHPAPGDFLVLLCAFFFALHIVCLDLLCARDDSLQIAFYQLAACAVFSALSLLCRPSPLPLSMLAQGVPSLLYLGLLSSGVCYLLQTTAQTVLPAAQASIVMSTEGLFGSVLSLLFGLALFRPLMALGGLLITLCVVLASRTGQEA